MPKWTKFEDLTGQKFGKLTVIKRIEKPVDKKMHGVYWLCSCECGGTDVRISGALKESLKAKRQISCPQCRKHKYYKDWSKCKVGMLQPIKEVPRPPGTSPQTRYWLCKCDCGNEVIVGSHRLGHQANNCRNTPLNCGCLGTRGSQLRLEGKVFGELTVIKKMPPHKRHMMWLCRCVCGNEKIVEAQTILRREGNECRCHEHKTENLLPDNLTKSDHRFLDAVVAYIEEHQFAPNNTEIGEMLGLSRERARQIGDKLHDMGIIQKHSNTTQYRPLKSLDEIRRAEVESGRQENV